MTNPTSPRRLARRFFSVLLAPAFCALLASPARAGELLSLDELDPSFAGLDEDDTPFDAPAEQRGARAIKWDVSEYDAATASVKAPRDPHSGVATGIVSPEDAASGLPTGR